MLKALEVGQPPVDRREYWIHRYASELAKIGVVWRWRAIVNHARYAQLTQLLPTKMRKVLKRLAGEDPFCCFPLVNHVAERKRRIVKLYNLA